MRRGIIAAVLVLTAVSCGARMAPSSLQKPGRNLARNVGLATLRTELQQIFTAPAIDHANWGVKVESLRTGETIYSYNAFKFLLPASNQKLFSSAVAAERLGWDYRFTTRLLTTGKVDASGTLQGDLVVVGNGDPSINPRHAARVHAFDDWATTLHGMGVRAINGRIIGDDNAFAEPGLGIGWTWENLPYGFGTAIGALQYNENQVVLTITPGPAGAPPSVVTTPTYHGMAVEMQATTAGTGTTNTIDIARLPGSDTLRIVGEISADAKPMNITASVENPTALYVNALQAALALKGILASGGTADIDALNATLDLTGATELIVDRSPPLSEIIDVCLKWSRNEYAETLLVAVAPPGSAATARAGLTVMRTQLSTWSIPPEFIVAEDGSGLSRRDYVTAHALTQLLTYLWREPKHGDVFRSTLPVAGVSGSLAERMKGTPVEGRVWAKTGTLSNVRSLSGYLLTRTGEPIVFSMLANNFQVPTAEIDRAMETALLRVFQLEPSN